MEICGRPKEVWNRSETVWNCRKAAISADPTFVWKFCGRPKGVWNRSETVWNCRKAAISADPTFVWKFVDIPKRSETGLKPSETVGKQLYPLILHLYGNLWTSILWSVPYKEVWNRSETVWNCRKAAISADPTFVWKFCGRPKGVWNRSESMEICGHPSFRLKL